MSKYLLSQKSKNLLCRMLGIFHVRKTLLLNKYYSSCEQRLTENFKKKKADLSSRSSVLSPGCDGDLQMSLGIMARGHSLYRSKYSFFCFLSLLLLKERDPSASRGALFGRIYPVQYPLLMPGGRLSQSARALT